MADARAYRVHLLSAPGHWAQYEGYVDVRCRLDPESDETEERQVFRVAVRELARTAFPDRPSLDSWRLIAIEDRP